MSEEKMHTIKDEDKQIAARRLQESCFLMDNWPIFYNRQGKHFKYEHFVQAVGAPNQFVTRMVTKEGQEGLMEITPAQLSYLVPRIRLFKVYYPTEDSEGEDVELFFDDYMTPETVRNITASRAGRGAGIGIKSFDWKLAGSNPAEADKNIEAKLTLYFQSMEELLTVQQTHELQAGGGKQEVRFIDLIQRQRKFYTFEGENSYNKKYFKIKAMVGWALPKFHIDAQGVRTEAAGSVVDYLNAATGTLTLTMTQHKFDFKENGAVEIEIDYIAYMEGVLSHPDADVLLIGGAKERVDARNKSIKAKEAEISAVNAAEKCKEIDDEDAKKQREEIKEDIDDLKAERREDLSLAYKRFISELMNSKRVFSVKIPQEEVGQWQENLMGIFPDVGRGNTQLTQGDAAKRRLAAARDPNPAWAEQVGTGASGGSMASAVDAIDDWVNSGKVDINEIAEEYDDDEAGDGSEYVLNYFFFGALIDIALSVLYEHPKSVVSEIKMIMGPLQFTDPRTGTEEIICISDVPVSLNMFMIWFMDKVVKKGKDQFFVKDFIKQAITALISPALGTNCWGIKAGNSRARMGFRMINAPATDDGSDRIKKGTKKARDFNKHKINSDDPSSIMPYPSDANRFGLKSFDYAYFYAAAIKVGNLKGNEADDLKKGIYHLKIGADRGLLKKVTFQKEDAPGLKEAKMVSESSPLLQSRELYNADVSLYGNSLWVPGAMVFINPTSLAPTPKAVALSTAFGGTGDIARDLGLGGYYMVLKVESAIESGKFETTLECKWQADGSGNPAQGRPEACAEENPATLQPGTTSPNEGGVGDNPMPNLPAGVTPPTGGS